MPTVHKSAKGGVRFPRAGFMLWQQFAKLIPLLNPKLKLGFDGATAVGADADGFYAKVESEEVKPVWDVTYGDNTVTIAGGVVQGHVINGITVSLSPVGTVYCYIAISETLSNNHGFINSFAYNGASLQIGGVVPTDNMTAGNYNIPLLKFVNGILAERYETTSLGVDVIDDGTSSGNGRMRYYPS